MKTQLTVPKINASVLETYCKELVPNCGEGEVLFDKEVMFEDGVRMAIQVIACSDAPAWTQGVLYDNNGHEMDCTSVGESFLGEYQIGDYVCEVISV